MDEVREDEAAGETARIYAEIRATLRTPVVNLIWRHLAAIPGALPWSWDVVARAAPRIEAALPAARQLAAEVIAGHGLHLPPAASPPPPGVADTIESYNRGNGWNLLSMTLLAGARAGQVLAPIPVGRPVAQVAPLEVPPYPRFDSLPPGVQADVGRLAAAGPAAGSGVRPSLWVHLGLFPAILAEMAGRVAPVLASAPFAAAHAALLSAVPGLLQLDLPPPALDPPAGEAPEDRAIRVFRRRIAEMVLVGRLL